MPAKGGSMKYIFAILMLFSGALNAEPSHSEILLQEWSSLRKMVGELVPDGEIGGYYSTKSFDGVTLMWRTRGEKGDEVIRLFFDKKLEDGRYFHVTYYKNDYIVEGRTVLRRFLGLEPSGWGNHTIDFETGDYLGSQGNTKPTINEEQQKILDEWNIKANLW